jgi:hypothetical protein
MHFIFLPFANKASRRAPLNAIADQPIRVSKWLPRRLPRATTVHITGNPRDEGMTLASQQ